MTKYISLVAAIVSASVLIFGYVYEREKEREFQITQTRQEIYTRLITNLTTKLTFIDRLKADPRMPKRVTTENVTKVRNLIAEDHPELKASLDEAREIMALLSIYGTDEAIEASVRFYQKSLASMQPGSTEAPDPGQLILDLRRSLFPGTQVNAKDINLILSN